MRLIVLATLLALSACGTPTVPGPQPGPWSGGQGNVPLTGQIVYRCDNGQQLAVDFRSNGAQVAIIGGPSMVLPSNAGGFSNGRYSLQGGGATATWDTPTTDPTTCRGS